MNYPPIQRLKPDFTTEWGTYTNPHIVVDPSSYRTRAPGIPPFIGGMRRRETPRPLGPGAAFAGGCGCGCGSYDETTVQGYGETGTETKSLILLLGAIGLIAVLVGRK